ncbi:MULTISPECIES: hypothetical protein [Paracoccus]|uniref:hypothetical protein n=1 Tax=Paracoccus TaxID=265 RepID=UPI001FB5C6F6|nr:MULTISPECIES: hypothetical protein [Paracoccus]MCJ1903075.1 hypothetical protein [Paracoccus versutus]MDF3907531.1 hypothetical protein [Paracoccus sp. AS002]
MFVVSSRRGNAGREQMALAAARAGWLLNRHGGNHYCSERCAGDAARDVTAAHDG